ncbi:MAG: hypothetical protein HYS87_01900 [Candidatus Colwellbacteria bacterium]|nr:hypothetical protein [Candidatus Colwellbacteria bacterium]
MLDHHLEKLAGILRVDKALFRELEEKLSERTGKPHAIDKIAEENDKIISDRLMRLGLNRNSSAKEVYDAIISKIESDDKSLFKAIGLSNQEGKAAADKICQFVTKISPLKKGFFLKKEKAREFLVNVPPKKIMESLGYTNVEEMLNKEDLMEVFAALRFLEDGEWLNTIFFKQYELLSAHDFEERPIEVRALNEKWAKAAEKFMMKKHHNVSHLKELGMIFVIPTFSDTSGETLRLLSLLMHYFHEVKYYSDLFEVFKKESGFALSVISLLRGDVAEERGFLKPEDVGGTRFLIVQRYLAKADEYDWRLFVPHINPEAMHWARAEKDIVNISKAVPEFEGGLDFWEGLDWVGDYFVTESGQRVLVSFDLVDAVMSLVKRGELTKYLYHHQEALWNKIFTEYFGEEMMIKSIQENIVRGWFEV